MLQERLAGAIVSAVELIAPARRSYDNELDL
jgi:hypothetical protein